MISRIRNWLLFFFSIIFNTTTSREKKLIIISMFVFCVSFLAVLFSLRAKILTMVPAYGGTYRDGIVGIPHFINPVLATSDADQTLIKLVYSGLMRETSPGVFMPDLAKSYEVSPDGLVYTFHLKENIKFHDNTSVTAHDIVYTVQQIQKNITPLTAGWQTIRVEDPNEKTVVFTLKQKYGDFLRMSTIGIIPAHIWEPLSDEAFSASDFNNTPVGTGPYRIVKTELNSNGIPEKFTLKRFKKFALGKPYLHSIILYTVANNEELLELVKTNQIDGTLIHGSSDIVRSLTKIPKNSQEKIPSTKVFGLFINRSKGALADTALRKYINTIIDRQAVIDSMASGYAFIPNGPVPYISTENNLPESISMEKQGWKKNPETGIYEKGSANTKITASFTITTLDSPELKNITETIQQQLQNAGIHTEIKIFQPQDLETEVLSTRNYEALMFGYTVSTPADLYAFWHSSQKAYPGLNITGYQNSQVDDALEAIIEQNNPTEIQKQISVIKNQLTIDLPAVFIYNPADIIVSRSNILGNTITTTITKPYDRFNQIANWYTHTDMVWSIFTRNTEKE